MDEDVDAIVLRVRQGNVNAFEEIVALYQRNVWRVAAYALSDRATAEELVQQTFVDAFRHLDRYETGRNMGAWLCGIARNLVRRELRRKARADRRFEPLAEHMGATSDAQAEQDEQAMEVALRECRERMTGPARMALNLRYDLSRSFEDIAATLDRTVPAARQLLQRARLALRECIESKMGLS